jgi:hypothetical protein
MEFILRLVVQISSVVVCAVPRRYRAKWPIQRDEDLKWSSVASGTIEWLAGAPGTFVFVAGAVSTIQSGFTGLIVNPYLPYVFLFTEGMIRLLAALGSTQILPTLPLQIVAWIHGWLDEKAALKALGPVVVDRVERGHGKAWDLRVFSCRPKVHWNPYITVRFENDFYQVIREERHAGPRPFVYLLRHNPVGRLVVVVYGYKPDEVLNPSTAPHRWRPD